MIDGMTTVTKLSVIYDEINDIERKFFLNCDSRETELVEGAVRAQLRKANEWVIKTINLVEENTWREPTNDELFERMFGAGRKARGLKSVSPKEKGNTMATINLSIGLEFARKTKNFCVYKVADINPLIAHGSIYIKNEAFKKSPPPTLLTYLQHN